MGRRRKNPPSPKVPKESTTSPRTANWRSMVFTSRYKNLRIIDPKDKKHTDRVSGEVVYGTEMVFKAVGNIGIYKPKSQREAAILLDTPNVKLEGVSAIPSAPSGEVVPVVTAPHPANVTSEMPK